MESVTIAIISGLLVAIPSVIATIATANKSKALMEYRMDKVEEKLDKHNGFEHRITALETAVGIQSKKEK